MPTEIHQRFPKAFFICGTGTDIGKTTVCAGLLRNLPQAQAIKVIQTGEELFDQNVYNEACPGARVRTLHHFSLPASPHLAATREGRILDVDALAREIQKEVATADLTLLEGSGGLMVPLSATETFLDLMSALGYPVILVVNNVLGAINHALLSISALRDAGLALAGLVFTHPDARYTENHPIAVDNREYITQFCKVNLTESLPYLPEITQAATRIAAWPRIAACLEKTAESLKRTPDTLPDSESLARFDQEHVWHPYCPAPGKNEPTWLVEKTRGNYIFLKDGRRLLDGMSSWWCAIHGYGHPDLVAALKAQASRMPHVMFGGLTHEPALALGQSLLPLLPPGLDTIFWADSGSVAVEVALKMAVQYWQGYGLSRKTRIISHCGGYHGDTLGAMSVGDPVNGMHSRFRGFLPEQLFAPRPAIPFHASFQADSLNALAGIVEKHHQECAAVIIEPIVQGAGGMWMYHPEYLKGLHDICRRHNVLVIYDEIATGFGRTGKMFAAEWAGTVPDILCLGKALTGGAMTLAATVCAKNVAEGISRDKSPLMHGPTFMATPLACRVALASLTLLQSSDWKGQVRALQNSLTAGLGACRELSGVKDVRVLGAIGVVEMERPVNTGRLRAYCAARHGVWIRPFNNLIYLMPPYTVTEAECSRLTMAVRQAIEQFHF